MTDLHNVRAVYQSEIRILNTEGLEFDDLDSTYIDRMESILGDLSPEIGPLDPDDGPDSYTIWVRTTHSFVFNSGLRSGLSVNDRIATICRLDVEDHLAAFPDMELADSSLDSWEQCSDVSEYIDTAHPMSYWSKERIIDRARLAGASEEGLSNLSSMTMDSMRAAFLVPRGIAKPETRKNVGRKSIQYGLDMERILRAAKGGAA